MNSMTMVTITMNDVSPTNVTMTIISSVASVVIFIVLLYTRCSNKPYLTSHYPLCYLLTIMTLSCLIRHLVFFIPSSCSINQFLHLWLSSQFTILCSLCPLLLMRNFNFSVSFCIILPCILSLIIAGTSFVFNLANSTNDNCSYGSGVLLLYAIPQLLCILFSLVMLIYLLCSKKLSNHISCLLYPLIPFISQLGVVSYHMYYYITNSEYTAISKWASFSSKLDGLILLFIFLLDPLFWHGTKLGKYDSSSTLPPTLFSCCRTTWKLGLFKNDEESDMRATANIDAAAITTHHDQHANKLCDKSSSVVSSMTTQTSSLTLLASPQNTDFHHSHKKMTTEKPSLSVEGSTPIIIFPPPPASVAPVARSDQRHPTSLELNETDFIGMFAQTPALHVITTFTTATATAQPPPSSNIMLPICYEMEEAVPWRVLEADEGEDEEEYFDEKVATSGSLDMKAFNLRSISSRQQEQHQQHHQGVSSSRLSSDCQSGPRTSSASTAALSYRKESWLCLYDTDDDDRKKSEEVIGMAHHRYNTNGGDEERSQGSHSMPSPSSSPYTVSEWLTKRNDSLDGVREQMGRTSKSIRRWCRNVNRHQQDENGNLHSTTDKDDDTMRPTLHVVHEEQLQ